MSEPPTIDTRHQVVRIKTRRGMLKVGPRGRLEGLWDIVRREAVTNAQVRRMCGDITRSTLIRWRSANGFPAPILTLKTSGGPVEVWAKTDVETWLESR